MNKKISKRNIGIFSASMVAFFLGLEGVLFTLFGLVVGVASFFTTTSFSIASILLRETIVLMALLIMFYPSIKPAFRRLKRKDGKFLLLSGLFLASGNFMFILAIAFAGSSYGPILTTLYPVFSLLLLKIIFKERQNWMVRGGIVLSIFSGLLFMTLPTLLSKEGFELKKLLGLLFGMIGAFLWAVEGMLIKKSIVLSATHPANHKELLLIRTFSSFVTTLFLVTPLGFIPENGVMHNPFEMLGKIVVNYQALLILFSISISIFITRFFHANAIKKIGPKLTAIIDTNNFIVPAFIAIFLSFANLKNIANGEILFETFEWWVWLLLIPLVIGVYITIYYEKTSKKIEEIIFDGYIE